MMKFKQTTGSYEITVQTSNVYLPDILLYFESFLLAAGFSFSGHLEIVDEDEYAPQKLDQQLVEKIDKLVQDFCDPDCTDDVYQMALKMKDALVEVQENCSI